jgi:hypothetical protein
MPWYSSPRKSKTLTVFLHLAMMNQLPSLLTRPFTKSPSSIATDEQTVSKILVNFLDKDTQAVTKAHASNLQQICKNAIPNLKRFFTTLTLGDIQKDIKERWSEGWGSQRNRYLVASILDIALITVVVVNGIHPAQRLISPMFSSIRTVVPFHRNYQTFTFAPGSAPNKFDNISINHLNYLSYFDIPVDDDGTLLTGSRGYRNLSSGASQTLFARAHANNTKVLITLTQIKNDSIIRFLEDPVAQSTLITQATQTVADNELDGVTIDFEYRGPASPEYQSKFTAFVENFGRSMHQQLPSAQVAVAVRDDATDANLQNFKELSKVSDRVLVMASDFAVPEVKNDSPTSPVFGWNGDSYWKVVENSVGGLLGYAPSTPIALETAWYGNGDDYPLYKPNAKADDANNLKDPAPVVMNDDTIEKLVAGVPGKSKDAARRNIPVIAKALQAEGILDSNVLAYALATIEHETDETFEPIDEIQGAMSARRLGYEGGMNYYGRGFIQLTHLRNYRIIGERIGMGEELAKHPELASTPEVAAKVLAAFFKDNNIANLASRGQFIAARMPVNPDANARKVASLAYKYEE